MATKSPRISAEELGEASLSDASEAVVEASEETLNAETFDLDAWLQGVRPAKRAVKLFGRADHLARLEEIAQTIGESPESDNVDDLIDEFEDLQRQVRDSGAWFVIEGRSDEWVEKFRRDWRKQHPKGTDDALEYAQIAAQLVSPRATADQLLQIADRAEPEAYKLKAAVTFANNQIVDAAEVLTTDFSSRRSAANRT